MREQHAHRNLRALQIVVRVKAWKYLLHGLLEVELALLVELHDGRRGGEALGERGHVEDGVLGHSLGGRRPAVEAGFPGELAVAIGMLEDNASAVPNEEDGARETMLRDSLVDQRRDNREVGFGKCLRATYLLVMNSRLLGCTSEWQKEKQRQKGSSCDGSAFAASALPNHEACEGADEEGSSRTDEHVPGPGNVWERHVAGHL